MALSGEEDVEARLNMSLGGESGGGGRRRRDGSNDVCRDFNRGYCPRGQACPYRHQHVESAHKSNEALCRDFGRGHCPRGLACSFRHVVNGRDVCRDFNRRRCTRGDTCPFSHTMLQKQIAGYGDGGGKVNDQAYIESMREENISIRQDNRELRKENRELRKEVERLQLKLRQYE